MKTLRAKLCLALLFLTMAAVPLFAQTDNATNESNNSTKLVTPAAPAAPEVPEIRLDQNGVYIKGLNSSGGFGSGGQAHVLGGPSPTEMVALIILGLIPFATIIAVCGMFFKARLRRNEMLHQTLRAMIDKGVAIPPELIAPPAPVAKRRARSDLRSGLVLLTLGLGVIIAFGIWRNPMWPTGLIFVLIGGALLLTSRLEKKDAAETHAMPK